MGEELISIRRLNVHTCAAEECPAVIDGVLSFCSVHWDVLSDSERFHYRSRLRRLMASATAANRWQFYQNVQYLVERIRNREGNPPDESLYDCLP